MRKKKIPETTIGRINAAARSCRMSYGAYVSLTGGAETPPQWLLDRALPQGPRCDHCGRIFPAAKPWQKFCSPQCRKAAYEKRRAGA